jgi:hypothetical protein
LVTSVSRKNAARLLPVGHTEGKGFKINLALLLTHYGFTHAPGELGSLWKRGVSYGSKDI